MSLLKDPSHPLTYEVGKHDVSDDILEGHILFNLFQFIKQYFNLMYINIGHTSSSMIQLRFFVLTKLFQAKNNPHNLLKNIS